MSKVLKSLPGGESTQLTLYNRSGDPVFYITKKESTGAFHIYRKVTGGVEFLGKGKSPTELEDRFDTKCVIYEEV